ncbi:hypothetical protein [Roseateles sp.]|uniref:hypothetical protein n=1 Tax=Roseateles sp. TaxID=1971397 RepID=UPI0025DBB708|nr:hypothetical protein [Roseateles sp.]MBV8035549.1 hypothetical protein [Roseateles sp.]
MAKNPSYSINVTGGDGVAVGTGNTVSVIKNEKHVHNHKSRGNDSGDDGSGIPFAIAIGGAILMAAFAYFFALHADTVYWWARGLAYLEAVVIAGGLLASGRRGEALPSAKVWILAILAMVAAAATTSAHQAYLPALSDIAVHARGGTEFWCGLSVFGKQYALQHATSTIVGFIPGLLFCLPPTVGFGLRSVLGLTFSTPKLESWALVLVGGILIVGGALLHTDMGSEYWKNWFKEPPSFMCPAPKANGR